MTIILSKKDLINASKNKSIQESEWTDYRMANQSMMLAHYVFAVDKDNNIIKVLKDRTDSFGKFERYSDMNKIIETIIKMDNLLGTNERKLH